MPDATASRRHRAYLIKIDKLIRLQQTMMPSNASSVQYLLFCCSVVIRSSLLFVRYGTR